MKWSDESIFQLTEQYEENNGYNVIIRKILKIEIILCFFPSISFAGKVCQFLAPDDWRLFPAPETGARNYPMCQQLK